MSLRPTAGYCLHDACNYLSIGHIVAILGRIECAAEGDVWAGFAGGIVLGFPRGNVEFATFRNAQDFGNCVGLDAAAGHHRDAVGGVLREAADEIEAFGNGILLAAGKDSGEAERDELLEGAEWVGRDVDGAVEDGFVPPGEVAENAVAREVDGSVTVEDAEDDAVGAGVEQGAGVVLHGGEFSFGVAEAAAARTYHGDDWNLQATSGLDHRADGWCEAAEKEAGTEFDALRSAAFGVNGGV